MFQEVPLLKNNVNIIFENVSSVDIINKFGRLDPPSIIINNLIYSQGHIPIIKKLSRVLIEELNK